MQNGVAVEYNFRPPGTRQHCRLSIWKVKTNTEPVITKQSIRRQDPNNYSDTETRCLVYRDPLRAGVENVEALKSVF